MLLRHEQLFPPFFNAAAERVDDFVILKGLKPNEHVPPDVATEIKALLIDINDQCPHLKDYIGIYAMNHMVLWDYEDEDEGFNIVSGPVFARLAGFAVRAFVTTNNFEEERLGLTTIVYADSLAGMASMGSATVLTPLDGTSQVQFTIPQHYMN